MISMRKTPCRETQGDGCKQGVLGWHEEDLPHDGRIVVVGLCLLKRKIHLVGHCKQYEDSAATPGQDLQRPSRQCKI